METLLWKLLNIFVALTSAFFICTSSHEIGHGIIGIFCGGKITKLNIGLKAHIRIENARYNNFTQPLMYVSGTLLPNIILLLSLLVYKRDIGIILYHLVYFYFSIMTIGTLITWTIVPVTPISAFIKDTDDIKKFMNGSKINPVVISLTAVSLCSFLSFLVVEKGVITAVIDILMKI